MGLFVLVGIMPFMVYVLKLHDATIMVRGLGGDSIDFFWSQKSSRECSPVSIIVLSGKMFRKILGKIIGKIFGT